MLNIAGYQETADLWRGARVLRLISSPDSPNGDPIADTLKEAELDHITCTLFLRSSEEKHGLLEVLLVLSASEKFESELTKLLDDSAKRYLARLRRCGFEAEALMDTGEITKAFARIDLTKGSASTFAVEEAEGKSYLPANIAAMRKPSWSELSAELMTAPGNTIAIRAMPTELLKKPNEIGMIRANMKFFEAKEDRDALACYSALEAMIGKPMMQLSIIACGQKEFMNAMYASFRLMGCIGTGVPEYVMAHCMMGADPLEPAALWQVKEAHNKAWKLTEELQRFSYLTERKCVQNLIAIRGPLSDIAGMRIISKPENLSALPDALINSNGIPIGARVENGQTVYLPRKSFTRHGVLVGKPGTGKTNFMMGLACSFKDAGIPMLLIEPTKHEYRRLKTVIRDLKIYTPGNSEVNPLSINLFIPPKGVTVEEYKPALMMIFASILTEMTDVTRTAFAQVINETYMHYGWRGNSTRDSEGVKIFGIRDFIRRFRLYVEELSYDRESKGNLQAAVVLRLTELIESNRSVFDTEIGFDAEQLLTEPTLIELDAIADNAVKSMLMSVILQHLRLAIRHSMKLDSSLHGMIMIDEAHVLLDTRNATTAGSAVIRMLQDMTKEIRAYGIGMIFADQSADILSDAIVDNTDWKLLYRMDSSSRLEQIMGMSAEASDQLKRLPMGGVYFRCSDLAEAIRLQLPNSEKKYNIGEVQSDEEIAVRFDRVACPFAVCKCSDGCDRACRTEAEYTAARIITAMHLAQYRSRTEEGFIKALNGFNESLSLKIDQYIDRSVCADTEKLLRCAEMMTRRELLTRGPADLRAKDAGL